MKLISHAKKVHKLTKRGHRTGLSWGGGEGPPTPHVPSACGRKMSKVGHNLVGRTTTDPSYPIPTFWKHLNEDAKLLDLTKS